MDIGLKIRRNPNFHYISYDPLRPTEELTHPYTNDLKNGVQPGTIGSDLIRLIRPKYSLKLRVFDTSLNTYTVAGTPYVPTGTPVQSIPRATMLLWSGNNNFTKAGARTVNPPWPPPMMILIRRKLP